MYATIAARSRVCTFSGERFRNRATIALARVTFALNTQRTLRIRLWACDSNTTRPSASGATTPILETAPTSGRNLLAGPGNVDYVVGDGEEGIREIALDVELQGGFYLCVDADNTDTSDHTMDVTFELIEEPRR